MESLRTDIAQCTICKDVLPHAPRPVLSFHPKSKIIIIGQAPGSVVHRTGIPWNDKSGNTLRDWMGVSEEVFYDATKISIIPMGFCYPGKGKTGDLPPRKECAPAWHPLIMNLLEDVELILLIGSYAQNYYLKKQKERTLTETVKNFKRYLPDKFFVLPHPSPRNNIWMKKNDWFKTDVLPEFKETIRAVLKKVQDQNSE